MLHVCTAGNRFIYEGNDERGKMSTMLGLDARCLRVREAGNSKQVSLDGKEDISPREDPLLSSLS